MTPDEYEFYARPGNEDPQGPEHRRLTTTVPVRFRPESKVELVTPHLFGGGNRKKLEPRSSL
jgi:hypothetical protein